MSYRARRAVIEAVRDVSFALHAGEIFAFLGPNGAGKTTTIKMIAGLVQPDAGEILVMGSGVVSSGDTEMTHRGIDGRSNGCYRTP
jgi:ABC-type multidrug transport system ATPase subunit